MVNKVILLGNVGRDPESKSLPSGSSVVNFSLATTRKWKNGNGERQEETTWHPVKAFGKLGEIIAQYVHKGDKLYVEGRLNVSQWEKDGQKHSRTEIIAEQMTMLGGKREDSPRHEQPEEPAASEPSKPFEATLDDIPFAIALPAMLAFCLMTLA